MVVSSELAIKASSIALCIYTCKWCLCCAGTWAQRWSRLCRNGLCLLRTSWTSGCGTWDRRRSQIPWQKRDGPAVRIRRWHLHVCTQNPHWAHRSSHVIKQSKEQRPQTCWGCFKDVTWLLLINFRCLYNVFLCNQLQLKVSKKKQTNPNLTHKSFFLSHYRLRSIGDLQNGNLGKRLQYDMI